MNNKRRKKIKDIVFDIERIYDRIDGVADDERDYLDNIPENMQSGTRYERSEECIDVLEGAANSVQEVISKLEEITI